MWYFFARTANDDVSIAQALSIPLGAVDVRTMLNPNGPIQKVEQWDFVSSAMVVNSPQLVLSAIYLIFNRAMTTFALSKEVNNFSIRPKGLRVSSVPDGAQRSEYFLQLPYRFALPLMFFSGILHWLCSQSFFLVSIFEQTLMESDHSYFTYNDRYRAGEHLAWSYSPVAIFILAILISIMYALLVGFGSWRLKTGMPISGSCSVVISAMCHQPADEDGNEAVVKPVAWGVSFEEVQAGVDVVECSFSSREMRQPSAKDMVITLADAEKDNKATYRYV
jgi:hypothetical protein